ncbi:universal stress protein [Paucibacter sp. KCTC 42545]|uniref:universal stress protein n=1 Tax=Paucibacter sp. KCTC 42545 TaxID=1768242 RepID=UPI000733BEC3|nr:universal stress protein [Paucibacter sp. KCTC 42545]ALT79109.1 universal stress protein UspA [Paucibacter sp. KCTC 42545]
MKILIAVDGSPFTKRMLAYLAAHDEWLSETNAYTVIHVVPAVPPRAAAVLDKEVLKGYYADEGEKVLKTLRTFFARKKVKVDYVNKVGPAADVIASTADKGDFDLLVLGSHGHGALGNLVMGSVATKVMANCRVPTLLVR